MASSAMTELVQHLRRTVIGDDAGVSDDQLLDRVVRQRDGAALAAIVHRHGPMVWTVCRRVLRSHHDAEDAFQATFLVLVRRAASIRPGNRVGRWLFGVARQTARYARAVAARRSLRERQVQHLPEPAVPEPEPVAELHALLAQEVSRLPAHYRSAIVGCDLEGRSRREMAQQLQVPEGTVSGWLNRGRMMLAKRLLRRGLAIFGGAAIVLGAVPPLLTASTIEAAHRLVLGQATASGAISSQVTVLMEGVLRTMFFKKLKTLVTALVLVLVAARAAVGLSPVFSAADPPAAQPQQAPAAGAEQPGAGAALLARDDSAGVHELRYAEDGNTVVTSSIRWNVIDIKTNDGPGKSLSVESLLQIWDARTGKLVRVVAEEKDTHIRGVGLASQGKLAVVIAQKMAIGGPPAPAEIRLLNARTWELERTLEDELKIEPGEWLGKVALSPDGQTLALSGASDRTNEGTFIQLWDLAGKKLRGGTLKGERKQNKPVPIPDLTPREHNHIMQLVFSPNSKIVAAGYEDGKVRLYDAATGKETKSVQDDQPAPIMAIAFSPDSKRLATTRALKPSPEGKATVEDRAVHVWELATGKVGQRLYQDNHAFFNVAFSPDGKHIATGGVTREDTRLGPPIVMLWDARTGRKLHTVPHRFAKAGLWVSALAFAPDSRTLAIGGTTTGDVKEGGKMAGQITFVPLQSLGGK